MLNPLELALEQATHSGFLINLFVKPLFRYWILEIDNEKKTTIAHSFINTLLFKISDLLKNWHIDKFINLLLFEISLII